MLSGFFQAKKAFLLVSQALFLFTTVDTISGSDFMTAASKPLRPIPVERLPRRHLGQTKQAVTLFGLGGEGVLRSQGRMNDAVKVIHRALDLGVNYFDTAPAYEESMDYYGAALGERRDQVFLACKTHERSRDRSLRLLDHSLDRLRTDHLDLWQIHDVRTKDEVHRIFGKGRALEALIQARADGRVRFLGITAHHDP